MHEACERIVPGARKAVLFIHGIVSTPRFWDEYVTAVPADVTVVNLLLPGHGGSVLDFGRTPWGAWQRCVQEAVARLRQTHEQVYLVGHSMGALLSILVATEQPQGVAGLLLMATPLRIRVKPSAMLHNILKGVGLGESAEELAAYYGTAQDWRVWRYISWIPRYLELFALSRRARKALPLLSLPTQAFMHGQDELVSPRSGKLLAECRPVRLTVLADSMHHDIAEKDRAAVCKALCSFCEGKI